MKIKILPEDSLFSRFIRARDKRCQRCGSPVEFKGKIPVSHQCSHFYTRGKWATRFDEINCCCLCYACHHLWGGDHREQYKDYMIRRWGSEAFDTLTRRSNEYANKNKEREKAKEKYGVWKT
jgi:hypothetical protein